MLRTKRPLILHASAVCTRRKSSIIRWLRCRCAVEREGIEMQRPLFYTSEGSLLNSRRRAVSNWPWQRPFHATFRNRLPPVPMQGWRVVRVEVTTPRYPCRVTWRSRSCICTLILIMVIILIGALGIRVGRTRRLLAAVLPQRRVWSGAARRRLCRNRQLGRCKQSKQFHRRRLRR